MNQSLLDTDVIIVGGGPVGLTLAIDLGQRGRRCVVLERNEAPLHLPKMELCNARTMEIYRRLSLSNAIRKAGYPLDAPMDVYVTATFSTPAIARLAYPSAREVTSQIAQTNDGSRPLEAYQRISQYTLEPLLKARAENTPNVTVLFGHELEDLTQDGHGVNASARCASGQRQLTGRYLVGCDGGASTVRSLVDIELHGGSAGPPMWNVFFRSDELMAASASGIGRHYFFVGDHGAALITQDDLRHHSIHAASPPGVDPHEMVTQLVGAPVDVEVLHTGEWTPNLLIAASYRERRVFLAGDSAHQYIPTGGFGLNTGIGDATDLAWKLSAALEGWGGPALLDSYASERRQVGVRNMEASQHAAAGIGVWRRAWAGGARGQEFTAVFDVEQRKCHEMSVIELGYEYADSPVVWQSGAQPDIDQAPHANGWRHDHTYQPSSRPGARLPHVWLADGTALHDRLGTGYTLLRLGDDALAPAPFERAFARIGAPLTVVELHESTVRGIVGHGTVLLRPDLHIVWSGGSTLAPNPDALAQRATGWC